MDFIWISTKDFVSFFHVSRWEIDKIECSKKYRTQMRGIELFDAKCCKKKQQKRTFFTFMTARILFLRTKQFIWFNVVHNSYPLNIPATPQRL